METIDACCSSEWHIAQAFHTFFPREFKYNGKRKWSYWDINAQQWLDDIRNEHLLTKIKVDFCSIARERATQLQQQILSNQIIDRHSNTHIIIRILNMTQKLQSLPFLKKVVRELQEFYDCDFLS